MFKWFIIIYKWYKIINKQYLYKVLIITLTFKLVYNSINKS